MPFESPELYLGRFADDQRRAIRLHVIFGIGTVVLGAMIVIIALVFSGSLLGEGYKTLLSVGGTFVGSLSGFQLNEINKRREKISAAETLSISFHDLKDKTGPSDEAEREKIKSLCWELIRTAVLGSKGHE